MGRPRLHATKSDNDKAYYARHRDEILVKVGDYREAHRDEINQKNRAVPAAANRRHAQSKTWREANAEHVKEYQRQWRKLHAEHIREYAKQRRTVPKALLNRKKHNLLHKLRKRNVVIEAVDLSAIIERDKMICGVCKKRIASKLELSFDHIVPLARGGVHANWNLQLAHRICNSKKGTGYLPSQARLAI